MKLSSYQWQSLTSEMHRATRYDIAQAKRLMAGGMTLAGAATCLNVRARDLDRGLFRFLGVKADVVCEPVRRFDPRAA